MKHPDVIKDALRKEARDATRITKTEFCGYCPYTKEPFCTSETAHDALELISQLERNVAGLTNALREQSNRVQEWMNKAAEQEGTIERLKGEVADAKQKLSKLQKVPRRRAVQG